MDKESVCNVGDPSSIPGLGRSAGDEIGYLLLLLGFPCGSVGKESTCNEGDPDWIPGLGRSAGEGIGYPLQYSGLENSMDCICPQRVRHNQMTFTLTSLHFPISALGLFRYSSSS